jgi:hypothetical protein
MCDTDLDFTPDQDEQEPDGHEPPADGQYAGVAWG